VYAALASHSLEQLLDRQPTPPALLTLITGVIALVAVAQRRIWRVVRNAITIAHEGGHALVGLLAGRRLQSIRLHADTSGLTVTRGRPTGLGMVLTVFAGYVAPSLLGLAGAWLLSIDRITITLWGAVALLLAVLLMIRNVYGLLAVIATGAVVFAVSWYASAPVQAAFAYAGVWFLLLGGVRPVIELVRDRRMGRARQSDADQLAGLTHLPGILWCGLFFLVSLAALGYGAVVLGVAPQVNGCC
jgi:hypothetical protein